MNRNSFFYHNIIKLSLLGLSLLFLLNCSTNTHTPTKRHKNLSYLYNDSEVFIHPEYQIYNFSKDSSIVFCKIPVNELLIKDLGEKYDKYALLEIHYRVYESLSVSSMIDSATFTQRIIVNEKNPNSIYSFKIKSPNYRKSYLRIFLKDVFSERKRRDYLTINKTRSVNRQSYLVKGSENREVLFGNEILINKEYDILSPLFTKYKLYVQEQDEIIEIANLPSSTSRTPAVKFISDTTYLNETFSIKANRASLIFLTFDTLKIKGVALYAKDSVYNQLRTPTQMLQPLSYLLSNKEYNNLLIDSNPKYALDKFWLKIGGNTRHASEMIKVYYKRVAVANKYFSSYKKGWMTDKGMIYIIYGEPSKVYKSETLERWIYGSVDSESSLSFDFNLQRNPFSENDFSLIRKESYHKSWFQAIDAWRNGRIYSVAK